MTCAGATPTRADITDAVGRVARRHGTSVRFDALSDGVQVWHQKLTASEGAGPCDPAAVVGGVLGVTPIRLRRWSCRSAPHYATAVGVLDEAVTRAGLTLFVDRYFDYRSRAARCFLEALVAQTDEDRANLIYDAVRAGVATKDDRPDPAGRLDLLYSTSGWDVPEAVFFDLTLDTLPAWARYASGERGALAEIGHGSRKDLIRRNPSFAYLDPELQQTARSVIEQLRGTSGSAPSSGSSSITA